MTINSAAANNDSINLPFDEYLQEKDLLLKAEINTKKFGSLLNACKKKLCYSRQK